MALPNSVLLRWEEVCRKASCLISSFSYTKGFHELLGEGI